MTDKRESNHESKKGLYPDGLRCRQHHICIQCASFFCYESREQQKWEVLAGKGQWAAYHWIGIYEFLWRFRFMHRFKTAEMNGLAVLILSAEVLFLVWLVHFSSRHRSSQFQTRQMEWMVRALKFRNRHSDDGFLEWSLVDSLCLGVQCHSRPLWEDEPGKSIKILILFSKKGKLRKQKSEKAFIMSFFWIYNRKWKKTLTCVKYLLTSSLSRSKVVGGYFEQFVNVQLWTNSQRSIMFTYKYNALP